jgi:hypothetical protein
MWGTGWECQFRGSTLVKLPQLPEDPSGRKLEWYRVFRRDHYLRDTVPTREVEGYVPPKVIAW